MSSGVLIIILLLGFSLYRRISRTVRFIPLRPQRLLVRTILWLVLLVIPLLEFKAVPGSSYLWYVLGLVIGVLLGVIAMRTVRYEERGGTWHYRMNLWIGAIVTLLFVGRILLEFSSETALVGRSTAGTSPVSPAIAADGSALLLYALVFAYYGCTGILLYRKARSFARALQEEKAQ